MKRMEIITIEQTRYQGPSQPISIAIGNFDGLHKGHQAVIGEAVRYAKAYGLLSGVITFDPHPRTVLRGEKTPILTPREDKIKILQALGVNRLYCIHFTPEFARLKPTQFIEEIIIPIGTKHISIGYDFRFGHMGEGRPDLLIEEAKHRYSVSILPPVIDGGEKISSSMIRNLIKEGKVEAVIPFLNRPYTIRGQVVHGDHRGRTLGFPTANLSLSFPYLLPAMGVYGVKVSYLDRKALGVMNIGVKPTFEGGRKESVEVHLIGVDEDLYGKELEVEFYFRIREERKFASVALLKEQILSDIQFALDRFL